MELPRQGASGNKRCTSTTVACVLGTPKTNQTCETKMKSWRCWDNAFNNWKPVFGGEILGDITGRGFMNPGDIEITPLQLETRFWRKNYLDLVQEGVLGL